ncbi:hypothetical protein C4097_08830 [Clostridioides difficile]|nr:hypothetical protein [Clostridioides difficile]
MSLTPRFKAIDKAILVGTGNSLVVCGSSTALTVSTSDLIMPNGTTTRDWTKAGSSANLNILSNSKVLYAELVWYSTVTSSVSGAQSVSSIQDSAITFTTPQGIYSIIPKYMDTYNGPTGNVDRYRAADVTTYVQAALSGSYTVSNVPISVPSTGLSNTRAGWTLTVIYRNDLFKPQMILYNSGISVATTNTPLQMTMSGYTTSTDPSMLKGNMFIACANGSPLDGNEYVEVGPSFAQLSNVGNSVFSPNTNPGTSPNNPENNFFSGVINVSDPTSSSNGLLNISGTNATNNNDGFVPTQLVGARNKWDIVDVDISNTLITNQSLLATQITESVSGDGVQIVAFGTQVFAQAPDITAYLELYDIDGDGEYNTEVGEQLVFSVQIKNNGSIIANNVILSTTLDPSVSFVQNSVIVNNQTIQGGDITKGVNIGSIPAYGTANVNFTVKSNSLPTTPGNLIYDTVNYSYQFTSGQNTITNNANTNTVQIMVQEALLNISKSASASTANIGDTVTYTINITNTGNIIATNILFQDKINRYSSFVTGSVTIDGTTDITDDPTVGISLQDLAPGSSTQILFQSKINSLPPSTNIDNSSCVSFGYRYNQYGYIREKTIFSNHTSIQVGYVNVIGERCNNNNYPNIGDTVTYTLSLSNVGNQPASKFQISEPTIPGTTFVSDSVQINGVTQSGLNPFTGFVLPNPINSQATTNISYQVKVTQLNPANTIQNIAQVPFKYQITPTSSVVTTEQDSNIVDTIANYVCMNIVESVDKDYAIIGDTLYYTVNITNNGNINATNTMFLSNIQSGTTLIPGTVTINGVSYSSYNPNQGFLLGTICASDTIEVTYQVKVNSVPTPNIVYNQSDLVYSYQPDPNNSELKGSIYSNTVQTTVNQVAYTITKTVNKHYAQLGDSLVYTTTIQNTGTVPLTNVVFADYIGVYMNLYPETVYINGVNYPSYNPTQSFPVGDIHPGDTVIVVFATTIVVNPPVGYIPNYSEAVINYQVNPTSPEVTKTIYSNTVVTYDPVGSLSLTKSVDKAYATVGDTLTYSFTATNNGTAIISNATFTDTLQQEATLVAGSVVVNGVSKSNYDPTQGFSLGVMNVGQTITISFKVTVNNTPSPNVIKNSATASYSYYIDPSQQPVTNNITSNTVTTTINSYSATITKIVDKSYAMLGNTLTYTVTANNTGTVPLTNVNLVDIIENGATFVPGSVAVNGVSTGYSNVNPNNGFTIPNISPGGRTIVTFQVTITSIPTPPQINNTASMNFQYQLSPTGQYISGSLTSNTVTTNIVTMSVTNTKTADKSYATLNDTITYTSVITNNGNESIANTTFLDIIPSNATFVIGSVMIGSTAQSSYDPSKGFSLGSIAAGASVTISFQVKVASVPSSGYITNTSNLSYQYTVGTESISSNTTSNATITYINYGNIAVTKSADRTIIKLNNIITYTVVIANVGNTVLKNINFTDIIQVESSFVSGSVYINGTNMSSYNPNIGFSLNDIQVGQQTTVRFEVTANSIPTNNELLNTATIDYSYYVNPTGSAINTSASSNTTTIYVYDTIISADKSVDKSIAKIGDTLNFSITITNDGNVNATNVQFLDILDSNIKLVANSVYIGTTQQTGADPSQGFSLPNIVPGTPVTVSFQATVQTRPTGNIIYNHATITYDYTSGETYTGIQIKTNTTQTYVAVGELTLTKSVNKTYATEPDSLTYTVIVKNTGSVSATSLNFKDLAPASTVFNINSVVVDGTPQLSYDPTVGFSLTDLAPNQYHTVTFSVNITSIPTSGEVDNTASTTFNYQLTPSDNQQTMTATSNTVKTYIQLGVLTLTKSVDKTYATIGDTLNYSITINNTGNANCTNILFKDIIQSNAQLISGSVVVNGISQPNADTNAGFNIPDIAGYSSATVTFSVKVSTMPSTDNIYNTATANYGYYINPSNPLVTVQSTSNTVSTAINVGSLSVTKNVNKAYATIGDTVAYTVTIVNTGNVVANNVNFRDVIPSGLTFITNSVSINGISYSGYDPYASFTLGNIAPGATVVVSFNTTVTLLPNPSLISNIANVTFSYLINPSESYIYSQVSSNTVPTQINVGLITLTKSVDKSYATMGNVLTYTVVVANTGNVDAKNVNFLDNLQSDVTFNSGTVTIGGTPYTNYDPTQGFTLGTIPTLQSVTVQFTVTVINNPTQDSVINYAIGTFNYYVNPNGSLYSSSYQSNTTSTIIVQPSLTLTKSVDKLYVTLNNTLNYSVLVKNTGNTPISNILFTDFLSNGATFANGTVIIDGISYANYNPIGGFTLPNNLVAGNTSLVQFQVTVNSTLPTPPIVTNYATSSGSYNIGSTPYQISATSNTVTTNINLGQLTNTKTVDKMYAKVGDTITYTSTIVNSGNVISNNLQFLDILQSSLTFVTQTVTINGVTYPSLDPTVGFSLPNLAPGQTVIVGFSAKINTLPTPSYITNTSQVQFSYYIYPNGTPLTYTQHSNTVTTNVVLGKINAVKMVDKSIATIGDILTYTVTLTNVGNVIDSNVMFQDTPSTGVTFNEGSVVINGVTNSSADPTKGFSLGSIGIGNVVTVVFTVIVTSVPSTNQVINQAVIPFQYVIDPKQSSYSDTAYSNAVATNIAYGSLSVNKSVDKKYATIGDIITYTVKIVNNGNINATNVVFLDPTPANSVFVLGSVTINGVGDKTLNPSAGFNLNIMVPGQIITVIYQVQVVNLC